MRIRRVCGWCFIRGEEGGGNGGREGEIEIGMQTENARGRSDNDDVRHYEPLRWFVYGIFCMIVFCILHINGVITCAYEGLIRMAYWLNCF